MEKSANKEIEAVTDDPKPSNVITFGKHKGKLIEEVLVDDPSYLDAFVTCMRDHFAMLEAKSRTVEAMSAAEISDKIELARSGDRDADEVVRVYIATKIDRGQWGELSVGLQAYIINVLLRPIIGGRRDDDDDDNG